jgi:basic membrane protein A
MQHWIPSRAADAARRAAPARRQWHIACVCGRERRPERPDQKQEGVMRRVWTVDRRTVLKGAGAAALAAGTGTLGRPARAADLVVGFIYVGPKDDYGYNQAHAEGAAACKSIAGVKIIEEENVPETIDVQKTMESMINLDGASLLFPTSFGYFDPHMLKMAEKYPKVQFRHAGGMWNEAKHPKNAGSYFAYIGMGQYLNGIVAGHMTKSKKLGFVAAKPIPQVLLNINSFALGARSVDPSITTQVIFTGEWSLPVKEAEATNTLADQGIDVVTCHVDGPKVTVETAERRGMFTCGYHANQSKLAPKGYLTGAEWNWANMYKLFIDDALQGKPLPNFLRGGMAEGYVKMSPYGPAVSDAAKQHADSVKAEILKGGYSVIKGPLKDNKGKEVVPAGTAYVETAIELESMNYLVEGVNGSI